LNIFSTDKEEVKPQAFSENLVNLVLMLIYKTQFSSCKSENLVHEFFKKTSDMKKIRDGIDFSFGFILRIAQKFFDFITDQFGFEKMYVSLDNLPGVTQFAEKVNSLSSEFMRGKILNYAAAETINKIYQEGVRLQKSVPPGPEYADSRKMLSLAMVELHPLIMKMKRSNVYSNGPRSEPLGIMLAGPPGVGKSQCLVPLQIAVTAAVLPEDQLEDFKINHNDFMYNRISENVFFDSYNGQFNCNFDDLGQMKDVAGVSNSSYMEVIRMINSCSYDLHMAHLEDKGNINFRSQLIWATTNTRRFRLASITDDRAFCRRFKVAYLVVPKPEFRIDPNELDLWKVKLDTSNGYIEGFNHLQFYAYNIYDGQITCDNPLDFDALIKIIINEYNNNVDFGHKSIKFHQSIKEDFINNRITPQARDGRMVQFNGQNSAFSYDDICDISGISIENLEKLLENNVYVSIVDLIDSATNFQDQTESIFHKLYKLTKEYTNEIKEKCVDRYSSYANIVKDAVILSGITATAAMLYSVYASVSKTVPQSPTGFRNKNTPLPRNRSRAIIRSKIVEQPHAQLASDPTSLDVLRKIYKRSMYDIRLPAATRSMGFITFIRGHDAIMPLHFAEKILYLIEKGDMTSSTPIVLRQATTPDVTIEIDPTKIKFVQSMEVEDEDICLARFPDVLPKCPDLLPYILDDFSSIKGKFTGALLVPETKGYNLNITEVVPFKNLSYTDYCCSKAYEYDIPTTIGQCGSILGIVDCNTRQAKLIGIHVAGNGRKGYSVNISRSMIEGFLENLPQDYIVDEQGYFDGPEDTSDVIEPVGFKVLYKAQKNRLSCMTSIIPSPLKDVICKSLTIPAKLKKFTNKEGKTIDPWVKARGNYLKNTYLMNADVLRWCTKSYSKNIFDNSMDDAPWEPRIFTFEEAVRGVPGVENCEGIPRGTSSGYPWVLSVPSGHKGKSHFFGRDEEYDFSSNECSQLRHSVLNIIDNASKGCRLQHVYMDFLKDERRPIEKVEIGKTRLVSASPVDLLIATRMYFLDFVRWYMSNKLRNGSGVGLNPFSSQWHMLARKLGNVNESNIIAGDFSAYDASLVRQVQREFLTIVDDFYQDGNHNIRQVLFEDVCNSKHIYDGNVYEWISSNPSGGFLTTILNSICNNIVIRYASVLSYCRILKGATCYPDIPMVECADFLDDFENHVYVICFGDDNIMSVGNVMKEFVNQQDLTLSFAAFGFKYTMESKDTNTFIDHRKLSEVSFLKRGFLYNRQFARYIAPLELSVILEMCQWTKKNDTNFDFVKENIQNALYELSAHGEDVFLEWQPKLVNSARRKLSFVPKHSCYDDCIMMQVDREGFLNF
jgi:hypothetical protein